MFDQQEDWEEWDAGLRSADPLGFPGYAERLAELDGEAVRTGCTARHAVIESRFEVLGGSMGVVAGEKVVRAYDRARDRALPMVVVTRSGGARMQEGMLSLLQMARTAAAARRHADAGLLSLAVHRSPTTGGVFASYGSLCDLSAVERGAVIGFAGPRVVEETVGATVAGRSHAADTAVAHGLVDEVVADEASARAWVEIALGLAERPLVVRPLPAPEPEPEGDGAWAEVRRARRVGRPSGIDVAAVLCSSWTELRGRDPVLRAGLATIDGRRLVVLASDRYAGHGRPTPAAYVLARRAIALAGRLGLPLLTLVDTPGADPTSASENEGIAAEIARTFAALAALPTASVSVCVGEGGSGGALALAATDRRLIQEHAVFSVIGPEGAAAILERDAGQAPSVAPLLALTSSDLHRLGVVDAVVPDTADALADTVAAALDEAGPGDGLRRDDAASTRWILGPG